MNKTTYKFLDKINLPSDLRKFENKDLKIYVMTLENLSLTPYLKMVVILEQA